MSEHQDCTHPQCCPDFDEAAAESMESDEVRDKWPRFQGECPDCGEDVIVYASWSQYILGDY